MGRRELFACFVIILHISYVFSGASSGVRSKECIKPGSNNVIRPSNRAKCPTKRPALKREKPEGPELPESSDFEPEEPDIEEPEYTNLGERNPSPKPCPAGNSNCHTDKKSTGAMGVYKAAAFIGMAILAGILVTALSLAIYCAWKRRRDRAMDSEQNSATNKLHLHDGYATPGGKCTGAPGAICTCSSTQLCCESINSSNRGGRRMDVSNGRQPHHYAGPTQSPQQQQQHQTTRIAHAIPYAQSDAYPSGDREYMGLLSDRSNNDPQPIPTSQGRTVVTQVVNHQYHVPHRYNSPRGVAAISNTRAQAQLSKDATNDGDGKLGEDPYYFKLADSHEPKYNEQIARPIQDRNIPDVIANRPLPDKDALLREDDRYEHIAGGDCDPKVKVQAKRGDYDVIFVNEGTRPENVAGRGSLEANKNEDSDGSYDKLDRSRQSFRPPREPRHDYNTISLDVLKI